MLWINHDIYKTQVEKFFLRTFPCFPLVMLFELIFRFVETATGNQIMARFVSFQVPLKKCCVTLKSVSTFKQKLSDIYSLNWTNFLLRLRGFRLGDKYGPKQQLPHSFNIYLLYCDKYRKK